MHGVTAFSRNRRRTLVASNAIAATSGASGSETLPYPAVNSAAVLTAEFSPLPLAGLR